MSANTFNEDVMAVQEADWLEALRHACAESTQSAVAKRLGVTAGTVCQVLAGKYAANTSAVEERVRGALMQKTVECPQLGELSAKDCLDWQTKPFAATNSLRVRMFSACKTCPLRRAGA